MFLLRIASIKKLYSTFILFSLCGCYGAPLIISSVVEPGSIKEGQRNVKIKGLFREGIYCTDISFSDPNATLAWQSANLKQYKPTFPISVKYIVEIPDTGLVEEIDLGDYSKSNFLAAYNRKDFYHSFSLNVEAISSYRADVFVTAIFSGPEEGLE